MEWITSHPNVHAIACDARHWSRWGQRPEMQEWRQALNARLAYLKTDCDWIIHLDADELVYSDKPISEFLETVTLDAVRLKPWEILSQAGQNDRCFFKAALPANDKGRRIASEAFGPYATCLKNGLLSHCWGKFFVRTGLSGVQLGIHAPYKNNAEFENEKTKDVKLLHFHGGDFTSWADQVEHRCRHGAYMPQYQKQIMAQHGEAATLGGVLLDLLSTQGRKGLRHFHRAVCTYGPDKDILHDAKALINVPLHLDDKRDQYFHRL